MILIITHKQDYTVDYLIDKLNSKKIPYLRLNCEDLLSKPLFQINDNIDFNILFENRQKINSVWFRRTQLPSIQGLEVQESIYFNYEFDSLLENIYCSLSEKKWLSDPFSIYKAENKILQLKIAKKVGFKTPKTLVTNSKIEIVKFYKSNFKTIIKPINSGNLFHKKEPSLFFTSILNDSHINSLNDFDLTPCIFQEYIEKEYELRVTVINKKVFSAKINSQSKEESKIDWRRSKLKFEKYILPKEIEEKCIEICSFLNIHFGAFDIIKNKNDDLYTFLEVNPNGQWAWIEMETGLKISNAIIEYLKS